MVIKLLLKVFTFWALILTPALGWGQCPTSVSISADPNTAICAGESVVFTAALDQTGTNLQYQWQVNGVNQGSKSSSNTFTGNNLQNGHTIRVVVTGDCLATPLTSNSHSVTVNPNSTVTTANTATICSGANSNIALTASTPSTFTWTVGNVTGNISGASAGNGSTINQTLTNPSSTTAGTVQYIVTPTATTGNCAGEPYTITVTVNPKPTVTTANTATICSGASSNIALTASTPSSFTWTLGSNSGNISGASAGSGSTINQTLTNPSSTTAGTVQYIVTPTATTGNCAGEPYTITVTVNPKPTLTTANTATICSGASPNISLTASTPSSFTWTIGNVTGNISGASAGNGSTINQTLTNPSNTAAGTVQYIVTPTATTGNCAGEPYKITVTVNPKPTVTTSSTATICSGGNTNISLTASTPSTFSWTIGSNSGNISGASAGSGATINQSLTNPSNTTAGTVEYIVTPTTTSGNCAGESYKITVTVNPKPTVTTSSTATICSGGNTNISLTASTTSSFSWTIGSNPGNISGASVGSGSTINQTLTNPSNTTAGTVEYIVTPTSSTGSCAGEPYTITVTVNPKPTVTTANTTTVCSGFGPNISLAASTPSSFSWIVGTITGGITGASNGSGATINQTLTNPSNSAAGTVQYIVTPTANAGSCAGEPYTITVTVNPSLVPSVSITSTSTTICTTAPSGSTPVTFTATPVNPGTNPMYQWKNGTTNVGSNSSTYTANSLASGSQISVVMTSNATCGSPVTATSNVITMTGFTPPAAPVFNPTPSTGGPVNTTLLCPPNTGLVYTVAPDPNVTSYNWTLPSGWVITEGAGTNSIKINNSNLNAGTYNLIATARNACGNSSTTLSVTIDTAASVYAGADASICRNGNYIISDAEYTGYINNNGANAPTWTASPAGSGSFNNSKLKKPTFTPANGFTGQITLTLTSTKTTGTFNCQDLSDQMILTVNAPPAITAQPSNATQTVCLNAAATPLSVTATGAGLTYQWYRNTNNSNSGGTLISGATSSSYMPLTTTAGTQYYYVVVGGTCSPAITSSVSGAVTVNALPAITAQPSAAPQILCPNATGTPLSVTATGAGLTYQWYSNTTNSNSGGTLITNATSATYTPATSTAGTLYYYVVVSGTCTPAVTSSVSGAVTVNAPPAITAQPSTTEQILCPNAAATQLSVTATGAGLTYQWYSNTTNSNSGGTSLGAGATSETYTPVTTSPGTLYYYVVVTGTCTPAVTSEVSGAVTVNEAPAIIAQPSTATQTLCLNGTDAAELSVTATGAGLTYQWYSNTTNSNSGGTSLGAGATSETYTPETTTPGTSYYYVVVSGTCTPPITSEVSGVVTVNEAPAITAQPSTNVQTLCTNETAAELSVTASGAGLTYEWYSNTTNSNTGGTSLGAGATSSTYTPQTTTPGTLYYYVVVSGACTPAVTSEVSGAVTVNEAPAITVQPSASTQTLCLSEAATELSVTATGEGLTYQWYSNTTNSNTGGTSLGTGATSSTYTPVTSTAGTLYYYAIVSGTCTPPVTSDVSGAVTVNEPVVMTKNLEYSEPVSVCAGFPVEFSIEATGTNLSYEWFRGATSIGVTTPTLSISQASSTDAGFYTVEVTGACGELTSNQVELIVNQSISINNQPTTSIPSCEGDSPIIISVVAEGDIYEYLWRKNGIPLSDGGKISGATTAELTITNQSPGDSGSYDVVISSPAESCSQIISNPSVVTVNSKSADPTSASASEEEICLGDSTELTLNGGGGGTGEEIRWYLNPGDENYIGTGNDFSVSPTVNTTYHGRYEDPTGCATPSTFQSVEVKVNYDATIVLSANSGSNEQTICINNPLTSIIYEIGGGGTGASITGGNLPEGITGTYNDK
jgi:large repetitive protein